MHGLAVRKIKLEKDLKFANEFLEGASGGVGNL